MSRQLCGHGNCLPETHLNVAISQKRKLTSTLPKLPPSGPPHLSSLHFAEVDTTYSEKVNNLWLNRFQLVVFKIIVCISELIIWYYPPYMPLLLLSNSFTYVRCSESRFQAPLSFDLCPQLTAGDPRPFSPGGLQKGLWGRGKILHCQALLPPPPISSPLL